MEREEGKEGKGKGREGGKEREGVTVVFWGSNGHAVTVMAAIYSGER